MRPTYTIVELYETPGRARMLRTLTLCGAPASVRTLGRMAGISHTSAGSILRDLEAMGIVTSCRVGRAIVYTLRRKNAYVRHMVLPTILSESTIVDELRSDLVADFSADSMSLILFGSYAYGEQGESSDIDVFALAEDERRRQALNDAAAERTGHYFETYGSPLSLMACTLAYAAENLRSGQTPFRSELETTGIILRGLGPAEWGIDGSTAEDAEGTSA